MLVIFFLCFGWFLYHAAPSLTVGDAGELIAAAHILGVAHAPGYPLYLLVVKMFSSLIPFSCLAYRANILSGFLMSGALTMLWLFWRRLYNGGKAQDLFLGFLIFLFLFEEKFVLPATEAEVFSLLAFGALLILLALERRRILFAVFAFALFLGNHHTLALLVPAFLAASCLPLSFAAAERFCWRDSWQGLLSRKILILIMLAAVLGFSVYAYLPVRAASKPALNWGNPDTPKRFWRILTRQDYGTFSLTTEGRQESRWHSYARQMKRFMGSITSAPSGCILFILAALGWLSSVMVKNWRAPGLVSFLGFFFSGPFFLCLGNPPFDVQTSTALERFYLLPMLMAGLAVPLPFFVVQEWRPGCRALVVPFAAALALFALWPLSFFQRRDYLLYDFGRNLLRSLSPASYFFIHGGDDSMYSMAYFILGEGYRPDLGRAANPASLRVRDRAALVFPSLYGFEFRETPKARREQLRDAKEDSLAKDHRLYYHGLRLDLLPKATLLPVGLAQIREETLAGHAAALWPFYSWRGLAGFPKKHYRERSLVPYYFFTRGQFYFWQKDYERAFADWRVAYLKGPDALWLKGNLSWEAGVGGIRLFEQGRDKDALNYLQFAAFLNPDEPTNKTNICVVLDRLGHAQEEILSCYDQASARFESYSPLYKNKGAYLLKIGKREQAKEAFTRYWQLSQDPQALNWVR